MFCLSLRLAILYSVLSSQEKALQALGLSLQTMSTRELNAFVSLFDGTNLRYKNHARQKS